MLSLTVERAPQHLIQQSAGILLAGDESVRNLSAAYRFRILVSFLFQQQQGIVEHCAFIIDIIDYILVFLLHELIVQLLRFCRFAHIFQQISEVHVGHLSVEGSHSHLLCLPALRQSLGIPSPAQVESRFV